MRARPLGSIALLVVACGSAPPPASRLADEPSPLADEATRDRARVRAEAVAARWVAEGVSPDHIRTRPIGAAALLVSIDDPERFFDGGEDEPLGVIVGPDGELEIAADVLAVFTYPTTCDAMGVRPIEPHLSSEPLTGIATIDGGSVALAFTAVHGEIEALRATCDGTLALSPSICGEAVLCRGWITRPVGVVVDGVPRDDDPCFERLYSVADEIESVVGDGRRLAESELAGWTDDAIAADLGCEEPDEAAVRDAQRRVGAVLASRGDDVSDLDVVPGCLQPNGEVWLELSDVGASYRAIWWVTPTAVEEMIVEPQELFDEEPIAGAVDFDGDDVPELVARAIGEHGVLVSNCTDEWGERTVVRGAAGTAWLDGLGRPFVGESGEPRLVQAGRVFSWSGGALSEVVGGDEEVRARSRLAASVREPYEAIVATVMARPGSDPCPLGWPTQLRDALVTEALADPERAAALASAASGCEVPALP